MPTTDKNVKGAIKELFQDVSNGKTLVANAITDKGVNTLATDTFQTMATNISNISGGSGTKEDVVYKTINDKLYRQVFYDDFDNDSLDKNYFIDRYLPSWTTKPLSKAKYDISNSVLSLKIEENQEAWCNADGTLRVTGIMTGVRDGLHKFNNSCSIKNNYETYWGLIAKNGYFETRCKAINCGGMHVAWWLIGIQDKTYDDGRTQTAEIDAFEIIGGGDAKSFLINLHNVGNSNITKTVTENNIGVDLSVDFHVYGMEWTTDENGLSTLDFYIDGTKIKTITSTNLDYPFVQLLSVYEYPDGAWHGAFDSTKPYPKSFDIDYLKLYKQANEQVSDLKVTSIEPINLNLETNSCNTDDYGVLIGLPSYVTLNYNDGSRTENYVMWQRVNNDIKTKILGGQQVEIKGNIANVNDLVMNNIDIKATITSPEAPTYSITNTLENVVNSNSITTILQGQSYSATLSPSDGCTITSVTITMGGVDITSDVYSNNVITINSVTGDVVINAIAGTFSLDETAKVFSIDYTCYDNSNGTLADKIGNKQAILTGTPTVTDNYINFGTGVCFNFDITDLNLTSFTLKVSFKNTRNYWQKQNVIMLGESTDENSHSILMQYDKLITKHKGASITNEKCLIAGNIDSDGQIYTQNISATNLHELIISYNSETNMYKEYFDGVLSYTATAIFNSQSSLKKLFNDYKINNIGDFIGGYKEISIYNKAIE